MKDRTEELRQSISNVKEQLDFCISNEDKLSYHCDALKSILAEKEHELTSTRAQIDFYKTQIKRLEKML